MWRTEGLGSGSEAGTETRSQWSSDVQSVNKHGQTTTSIVTTSTLHLTIQHRSHYTSHIIIFWTYEKLWYCTENYWQLFNVRKEWFYSNIIKKVEFYLILKVVLFYKNTIPQFQIFKYQILSWVISSKLLNKKWCVMVWGLRFEVSSAVQWMHYFLYPILSW